MAKENNKNNKNQGFSQEKGNLEIVPKKDEANLEKTSSSGGSVSVSRDGINVKKGGNIVIGSLNIIANPLKKRAEKHYKRSRFHLIADIILVAMIVVLFASFFLIRNWQPRLDVSLEAKALDKIITSGEIESFEISYRNNNEERITDANLAINLPENFILLETYPRDIFNTNTNTFKIGDLESGAKGSVKISGMILGEINERQVLSLSLNYFYKGNRNNTLNSLIYLIEESIINLSLDLPGEVYKGTNFSGKLIVRNNGEKDLEEEIELSFLDSPLEIKNIDMSQASLNNNIISFSGLEARKTLEISFEALTDSSPSLSIKVAVYLNTERGRMKQQEKTANLSVVVPKFKAFLETDARVLEENQSAIFKLNYENKEEEDIRGLKFEIRPESSAFAVSELKLKEESEKYEVAGNNIKLLEDLKKGEAGSIEFEVVFRKKKIGTELNTSLAAAISYRIGEKEVSYKIISPKLKFFSDLHIISSGRYYSEQGDQLGVGPLPPVVDVPTTYWIFWEIDNLGNDLKDLSISADLGKNVAWTENKSLLAGKMRYGAIGGRVIWNVDEVSKEGGKYRAGFEVKLIPSRDQKGGIVDLVKNIKYSAYDSFAEKEITGELESITTNLEDDKIATGKGKVVEMELIN